MHERGHVGLAHRRLSIIDLEHGHQPMSDEAGRWITYNGEVYNYPELKQEIGERVPHQLRHRGRCCAPTRQWGTESLERLRGMFAYAIWDEQAQELVCARDRFGIKPFYYAVVDDVFYFASEAKALLPMLPSVETDLDGLKDYLAFQFCLAGKTLFKGIRELQPGHYLRLKRGASPSRGATGRSSTRSTGTTTPPTSTERIAELLDESVRPAPALRRPGLGLPLRRRRLQRGRLARRAASRAACSPSPASSPRTPATTSRAYARIVADQRGLELHEIDIGVEDFLEHDRERRLPHGLSGGRAPAPSPSTWSPAPPPSR